jgi:PPE-repeat protein
MDYGALPPEINSARMYTGAGAEPMLAAAAAWDRLAAELRSAAAAYSSVISGLSTAWLGPSAATMAAAAAPYAAWLTTTAVRAEQTAGQARAAAVAYESAFAATVPPPVIAANRARFASLVASNIFGQNTAAIAATEAHYAGMWAQDAAAMYGYAAQSAAASALTPFKPPPHGTNPAATTNQAVAVAHATGAPAATTTQSVLAQWVSATPSALHSLAAPTSVTTSASPFSALTSLLSSLDSSPLATAAANFEAIGHLLLPANTVLINTVMALVIPARHLSDIVVGAGSGLAAGLGSTPPALGSAGVLGAGSAVSAGVGEAGFVGALSVPSSWAAATPAIRTVAAVLSGTSTGAVSAAAVSQGSLYAAMAVTGMAGAALGAMVPRPDGKQRGTARKKLKDGDSPASLQRLVAEMAEKPESVQHWHTDSEHLDALLAELRKKPGTHAVHVTSGNSRMKPTHAQPNQVL